MIYTCAGKALSRLPSGQTLLQAISQESSVLRHQQAPLTMECGAICHS
jgi:hypothetical protein